MDAEQRKLRYRIRDKNGDTALDLVPADDTEVIALIRKARAGNAVARGDIAEDGAYSSFYIR